MTTEDLVGIVRDDMNRLRGRLFQAIETIGLPEQQESAIKGVIRTTTYDSQAGLESAIRGEN
jgi:hypothetical protein